MTDYGSATEKKIAEIVEACQRYGDRSIVALSGVPGTGKSYTASIAAQRYAEEPLQVKEVQFHQSFSYEEFIEGLRIDSDGGIEVKPGIFLEMNELALGDESNRYVLLIEELTRANLSSVLGELMTYLEHRDRHFTTVYSRRPVQVARNLTILATFNPRDRSAIELDDALLRRLRIIRCPPDNAQLREMLNGRQLSGAVISKLCNLFDVCKAEFPEDYEHLMPFGHGVFADVQEEVPDLHRLWVERVEYFLRRPLVEPHPFTDVIQGNYPWSADDFQLADE